MSGNTQGGETVPVQVQGPYVIPSSSAAVTRIISVISYSTIIASSWEMLCWDEGAAFGTDFVHKECT